MKKLVLLFMTIIFINLIIFCYNNPIQNKTKKPLWLKQYEQRNKKEEIAVNKQKVKKQQLKMIETKIKFQQEQFKNDKRK